MITIGLLPLFTGLAGDLRKARRLYAELRKLKDAGRVFVPSFQLLTASVGAGDLDAATEHAIEATTVEHDTSLSWLAIYSHLRHIHHHPGFRSLVTDTLKLRFSDTSAFVSADAQRQRSR
jgi:hypothetical protein